MTQSWCDFNDAPSQEMDDAPSTDDLRRALLDRLEAVLLYLLPAGRRRGSLFEVGDILGNAGESLKIDLRADKAGMWYDFATGEGGDIFDLWAARHHLDARNDFPQLVQSISAWLGVSQEGIGSSTACLEATPQAPQQASRNALGSPSAKWDYQDETGTLIACVYRYDTAEGKQFRPWDVLRRKHKAPDPRPLYNQPGLKASRHVILVEGEKAAEALIRQGFAATTAMFGAKAPLEKTDWSPLKGKHVLLWPDHDAAGKAYMERLQAYLPEIGSASLTALVIPEDKPKGWDAADAVAEGVDIAAFISSCRQQENPSVLATPAYTVAHFLDDTTPMPEDLIAPRVLTPGGLLVFGGAPKVGKSDFLLALLAHMASGAPFLGLSPPRPLRIFYLQAEIGYHYLRERLQQMAFDENLLPLLRENLVITPQFKMILDKQGVDTTCRIIQKHFVEEPVDIIVVDPLRNVFDGGESDLGENDNSAMLFFLQQRLEALRDQVNPEAGLILVHHTRKIEKKKLEEDPFQALSGASSLRGYYSTGIVMFQPEESQSTRQVIFELRNGPRLKNKVIDKINQAWQEVDANSERLVQRDYGQKLDAERRRKRDVILQIIYEEARMGRVYTMNQFCQAFENRAGLGGKDTLRGRLDVLTTKGYIKFFRDAGSYGLVNPSRTKYGYMCVEDMYLGSSEGIEDPHTGEISVKLHAVYPTHYKCRQSAAVLPVENARVWVYDEEETP